MRRWTKEEVDYLTAHYKDMSYIDIGKHLDRPDSAIRAKCFDLKLVKNDRWTEDEENYVRDNYPIRQASEIAQDLDRTETAVHIKAKKLGIKRYPYYCDENYFENIDTEEKAYWLGFIYADGYVTINKDTNSGAVGIELQDGDTQHLKKFNKSIGGNYKITFRDRHCNLSPYEDQISHMCCIRVYSRKMVGDLISHGVYENKTYCLDYPNLDEPLMRHFIRGFFDGDGCVSTARKFDESRIIKYPSCTFCCYREDFLKELQKHLASKGIKTYLYKGPNIYTLDNKGSQSVKLLNYMYEGSQIYLDRKYKRYQNIIEYRKNKEKYLAA